MSRLIYKNPILHLDYSDPDAIRVGDDFFMVASSFNHVPGLPVLHSKNLVEWKLVNYVFENVPFERFKDVQHGHGAWAPSIRYHNGIYYCIIPFPDEGIYVSQTTDPFGKWSDLWCVIEGKGIIDPCPIWTEDGKCYIATGFAKSRCGFNSVIGLYEVTPDLKTQLSDYTIVYDGHDNDPTIEGPKFNVRNGYYYIMAPAGSVKTGWQVCLRSKNIYGPYERKVVLFQSDTQINGPHQGALVDIDDNDNWAFLHFQDKKCYGRVVHLQPVTWVNDWPICGECRDELLAGTPVATGEYPISIKTDFYLPTSDDFCSDTLSLIWQTPANKKEGWYELKDGLKLNCYYHNEEAYNALNLTPNIFMQKLAYLSFDASVCVKLDLQNEGDEIGLCLMGKDYAYVCVRRENGTNVLYFADGHFGIEKDTYLKGAVLKDDEIILNLRYDEPNVVKFGYDEKICSNNYYVSPGRWIGSKVGIYAKGKAGSAGSATFRMFDMK